MAVANNADDYAATRVGIYFPGVTPYYDGQCVSLVKWFLGEMAGVANWNAARGNAKDMGRTLVAQGLAREVPFAERRRGDVIAYEYGTYGHIAIQLSGGRVFEENVNMPGTSRKYVVDDWVYTSRIGSESEAWRAGKNPHIYRLNGYSEPGAGGGSDVAIIQNADNWRFRCNKSFVMIRGRSMGEQEFQAYVGQDFMHLIEALEDDQEAEAQLDYANWGRTAKNDHWDQQIYTLRDQLAQKDAALAQAQADLAAAQKQVQDLGTRPTQADLDKVTVDLKAAEKRAADAQAEYNVAKKLLDDKTKSDTATDNAVTAALRSLWRKLTGGN